jgi:hypothetical protein
VKDQSHLRAVVIAGRSFSHIYPRTTVLRIRVELPKELAGPLPRHATVGHVVVEADGRPVTAIPLLLKRALPAVSPVTQAVRFLSRPVTLLVIVLVVCAAVAAATTKRQRSRAMLAGGRR